MQPTFQEDLVQTIQESIQVKQAVLDTMLESLSIAAGWMVDVLRNNRKLLLFGNGGSAADAQHIAAEFVGRFERERVAWPAIALTTDTSILTAITNDYGIEQLFSRQIEALGQVGDLVLAISTSGNSPNVIAGIQTARKKGLKTIGFTGKVGGEVAKICDLPLCFPSTRTARIQEAHMTVLHALCEIVETELSEG